MEHEEATATDALVDGDVVLTRGTARAALRHRDFRIVWSGTLGSNVGTWMQNIVLAAFGYKLTHSAAYVSLLQFAQLGPLLFLATPAGVLADMVDRRKLLVTMQMQQLVFSFVLAWLARGGHPNETLLVGCVLVIGIGNALSGPALSAALPQLVPRADLPGAVSLQSFQMNASRVIGPAIGGVLFPLFGAAAVFSVNAVTYLFAVAAIIAARFPPTTRSGDQRGLRQLASGFTIAWNDRLIRRILTTMVAMSFFVLPFIGLMPVLAADNLGMDVKSLSYGLLYAAFGTGAALGAMSIGTFLAQHSKPRIVRVGFGVFAVLLAAFALCRTDALAYIVVGALGFAYFATVTSMSTVLQEHLDDAVRGRVMALWIMAFGGTVPLGTLAAGPLVDRTSITAVTLAGAAVCALLVWVGDLSLS
ncbi:MAG TPA: MFS transporter [Acidimicrobiales bacterium]|nr:MFS transporter [Acidimicrobiales bacterium]